MHYRPAGRQSDGAGARLSRMDVQIFGIRKSAETRAALRFFAERRVRTHFVDFAVRGPARGELGRFAQRFGVPALIDRESRRYRDLGFGAARFSETQWLEKLLDEPLVLRMPLVRQGGRLTIGPAQEEWVAWLTQAP